MQLTHEFMKNQYLPALQACQDIEKELIAKIPDSLNSRQKQVAIEAIEDASNQIIDDDPIFVKVEKEQARLKRKLATAVKWHDERVHGDDKDWTVAIFNEYAVSYGPTDKRAIDMEILDLQSELTWDKYDLNMLYDDYVDLYLRECRYLRECTRDMLADPNRV